MPAQQGIMSAYQLMPHTHQGIGQGGIINNDDLFQSCGCHVSRNAPQVIPNNVITQVLFDNVMFDIGGDFDADGVDSDFTAPATGYYYVMGNIRIQTTADASLCSAHIYVEGGRRAVFYNQAAMITDMSVIIGDLVYMTAGQSLDLRVSQICGGNRNIGGGDDTDFLTIFKIGE